MKWLLWLVLFGVISATCLSAQAQANCNSHIDYASKIQPFIDRKQYDQAIAAATCAIQFHGQNSVLYLWRGYAYFLNLDYDNAIADLSYSDSLDPNNPGLHYYWGASLFYTHEFHESIDHLNTVLKIPPDLPNAKFFLENSYMYLGYDYIGLEQYADAVGEFKHALERDPNMMWSLWGRGQAYAKLHQYQAATADFKRLVKVMPEAADWSVQISFSYVRIVDYEQNVTDMHTASLALQLNPQDAHAYHQRGKARLYLGELDTALEDLNQAIELQPDDQEAYYLRGFLHYAQKDDEKAVEDFSRAIELDPKNAASYWGRESSYRALADYEHAVADGTRYIELKPDEAGGYLARGIAYSLKGDDAKAAADFLEWADRIQTNAVDGGTLILSQDSAIEMANGSVFRFQIEAKAGQHLRLSAISARRYVQVDTLIIVLGPDEKPLTGKDDLVANKDSRAIIDDFKVPEDGRYTLIVTHAGGNRQGPVNVLVKPTTPDSGNTSEGRYD